MNMLALDIGGANLKLAHAQGQVMHYPFALWKQPELLSSALIEQVARLSAPIEQIRVTMTGELCDCFSSKARGVAHILRACEQLAQHLALDPLTQLRVWSTQGRWMNVSQALQHPLKVAASNWHAQAMWIARLFPEVRGLLLDVGSTTTDLIAFDCGQPQTRGLTDMTRLLHRELLYTGILRTSLMNLGPTVNFQGQLFPIMAEHFACIGDVYLLLGQLSQQPESTDTADGKPFTHEHAACRVLRMIGADLDQCTHEDAVGLARGFADVQMQRMLEAIRHVTLSWLPEQIVVSGSGDWLAEYAARQGLPEVPVHRLATRVGSAASTAACAVALLHLPDQP